LPGENSILIIFSPTIRKIVAEELDERVKKWTIFNEPWVIATAGYLTGRLAPGIKDLNSFLKASHNLLLAQGKAIQALRNINPRFEIGTIYNLAPVYPVDDDERNKEAANIYDQFLNRWYLDPLLKGEYPPLAKKIGLVFEERDLETICQDIDFLGVNYYTRKIVAYDLKKSVLPLREISRSSNVTEMSWEIYPRGLYEILIRLKKDYNNLTLYITENGVAFDDKMWKGGTVQDDNRIYFLRDHLIEAKNAVDDGVDLRGYFVWSLMDNFEWAYGYSKRFGLIYIDYKTLERIPKKSFYWYKKVIEENGFELSSS
jgi:beta-glucosidase